MTSTNPIGVTRVIVGVDTHRDEHVAVAIDCLGARLGQRRLPTAPRGYESRHCWASGLGEVGAVTHPPHDAIAQQAGQGAVDGGVRLAQDASHLCRVDERHPSERVEQL